MKQLKSPRLMLVASMIIFGTLGPFVRNISVSSGELALYRAILAALLIAIFLIITKQKIPFKNIKKKKKKKFLYCLHQEWQWVLTGFFYFRHISTLPFQLQH